MEPLIKKRYDFFSQEYRDFISSEETRIFFLNSALELGLSGDEINAFDNGFTLFLLALLSEQELIDFLVEECDIEPTVAKVLVEQFSNSLPENIRNQLSTLFDATKQTTEDSIVSDIAETEAALARVSPVRTMARDMHDLESQAPAEAPVYRSEQPTRMQTNPPNTTPRWDSEQR